MAAYLESSLPAHFAICRWSASIFCTSSPGKPRIDDQSPTDYLDCNASISVCEKQSPFLTLSRRAMRSHRHEVRRYLRPLGGRVGSVRRTEKNGCRRLLLQGVGLAETLAVSAASEAVS